jgi:hypothetical protein
MRSNDRPRHYAERIMQLPEAEREAAYAEVPEQWREWVRFYVRDWCERLRIHESQGNCEKK